MNAPCNADHNWSLFANTLPASFRRTIGHKCSMGFRSGDCPGQTPPLRRRTRFARSQAVVDSALCAGAPSCWNLYPGDLKMRHVVYTCLITAMDLTPSTNEPNCTSKDALVLRLVDLVWAATYTNRPGVVHGCPDHQPFRMTDGRDNVLGVIPVHPLLDPAPEDVRWDKWQVFPISLHFSYRVVYNLAFGLFSPLPHWRFRLPCFLNLAAIPEKHEALGQGTFYACLPWRPPFDKSFSSFKIAPYERGGFWLR